MLQIHWNPAQGWMLENRKIAIKNKGLEWMDILFQTLWLGSCINYSKQLNINVAIYTQDFFFFLVFVAVVVETTSKTTETGVYLLRKQT